MDNNTNQSSKDTAASVWLFAAFFSIFSSAYFYITKKEDALVQVEAKRALNWSLNLFIICMVFSIIIGIVVRILPILATIFSLCFLVVFVAWIYICITNWQRAKQDQSTEKPALPIPFIDLIK